MVARRGRGPLIVAGLVAGAFALGVLRPWDWLAAAPLEVPAPVVVPARAPVASPPSDGRTPADPAEGEAARVPAASLQAPTCGYPVAWRTAAVQLWGDRRARVWTAADAVPASGPADPAIPFNPIVSDVVEALGWCAPVSGPDRPPLAAEGALFRVRDGLAIRVVVDRLEPPAGDALGELWAPPAGADGRRPAWEAGSYVVRLATPAGDYVRFMGLEIVVPGRGRSPAPPSSGASSAPTASPSPTAAGR